MNHNPSTTLYDYRARFFWLLATIFILCLSLYVYAINMTARNIATRQDLEKRIAKVSTNLDSLEFAYIELRNNVTIELAYQYGFREVKNPLYIPRAGQVSFSFNNLNR